MKIIIDVNEEDIQESKRRYDLIGEANETFGQRISTAISKGKPLDFLKEEIRGIHFENDDYTGKHILSCIKRYLIQIIEEEA